MRAVDQTPDRVTIGIALRKRWFEIRSLLAPRRCLEQVFVGSSRVTVMVWKSRSCHLSLLWIARPRDWLWNIIVGVVEGSVWIWALRRVDWEGDAWVGNIARWCVLLGHGLASHGFGLA